MRSFVALDALIGSVPFDLVRDLRVIDTGRGSEALYRDKLPALLTSLAQRARVASIEASSAIEGVVVESRERADVILSGKPVVLRDRSERELAGYRAALDYLYQEDWRPLNTGLVLHLHRLLFSFTDVPGGGFKTSENIVVDRLPDGTQVKRFTPVSAAETPQFVDELVRRYSAAIREDRHHPVLLVGLFVLDLLTIHPFLDGNGRLGRLVIPLFLYTHGLLSRPNFYLSEYLEANREEYYDRLLAVSANGDWTGWAVFFLQGIIAQAEVNTRKAQAILKLHQEKRDWVVEVTHSQYAVRALDWIFQRPIFQTPDFIRAAQIPGPTARTIIRALRDNGMLREVVRASGRAPATFMFGELLNIAEGRNII